MLPSFARGDRVKEGPCQPYPLQTSFGGNMIGVSPRSAILGPVLMALLGCAAKPSKPDATMNASSDAANPLLAPWTGPWGGVPPFGRFKVSDLKPALQAAMDESLAEIDRIAADPAQPTFDNTIAAMDRAGHSLDRVGAIYGVYTSTMDDAPVQAIESEMEPKLAAFSDRITQNSRLFARIDAVYASRSGLSLTPEQQRLLWLRYIRFVRAGAKLDDAAKARLSELNQQLAVLYTKFRQNVLEEEGTQMVLLESEADLAGLSPSQRDAAAAAAAAHGKAGKWAILNTRSSVDPFLTWSTRRDLREKVWRMFTMHGDNGDAHDNKQIITEILKLRAQRAKLLGYPTHAHWQLEDSMAKTPERAVALLEAVWKPAVARVHEEVADMQAIADREKAGIRIAPWDYHFYAEKVRKAKYDLDENEIKPYLQLEKLREGIFYVAGELFGFQFSPVTGVPTARPDIRVYEVKNAAGKHVGLWYFDPYARSGKQSGAWMNEYRPQERF